MSDTKVRFGEVTVPSAGSVTVASGHLDIADGTLVAHPSNSGILYVRNTSDTGNGYPLSAGDSLEVGRSNLGELTASGVVGARLAYAYHQ